MIESTWEKIEQLTKEIRDTPYHKGTEHHIGLLKAKVAKLKREYLGGSTGAGGGLGYAVKKEGDANCALVGPPSVGKSTLLNQLTRAKSKTGYYDFTTMEVVPGMMDYQGAKIQIFDVPGLVEGAAQGKGRGKRVIAVLRSVDLIIIISDLTKQDWIVKLENELYQAGIRLNQKPPQIRMRKTTRGGVRVIDPFGCFEKETVIKVAQELGVKNGEISFLEPIKSIDLLVDFFSGNRVYLPAIRVINKSDLRGKLKTDQAVLISAKDKDGLDQLKQAIWDGLGLIRVYLKKGRSAPADKKEPLILKKDTTIIQAVNKISSELSQETKQFLIWGPGARFPGQSVPASFKLRDETELLFVKG
ncbi:MAG: GTPase [Patescibacteria group bacterium]